MSCTTSETENDDSITCGVPNGTIDARDTTDTADTHSLPEMQQPPQGSYEDDSYSSIVITPWIVAGVDLTRASAAYRKAAHQLSKFSPLNIGHSLQDILSFTGGLLLCPSQHSEVMMVHLDKVDEITQALLSGTLDKYLDWNDHEYLVLSRVIKNLAKNIELVDWVERAKAIDETELQLQKLASDLHPIKKAIVKGIIGAISKLPAYVLKDERCIGESELTCSYFDPILSRLLANPASGVHLRWSDITVAETPRQRPDAVISKMRQLSFGPSLGFGEAKVQSTPNYDLCHDLLRLALFGKESIDMNKLAGCLSFQIHGNAIQYNNWMSLKDNQG
ncbi:hypothetical protein G6F37_012230 [Rhizopus arrhizus]|nr:hypothetical protein G6F37_012230 [Rhizopus arrhizus]